MQPISNLTFNNPFFLAPMEAVNCASFRVLCRRRGASLVYTDMIDADIFAGFLQNNSKKEAIKKFVNPQPDEKPLSIQLGGSDLDNLKATIGVVQKHATLIDYNVGCPLGYMLGKKGGVYLQKHPDQLVKKVFELRQAIHKPFTVKIRSGWDESTINAVEVSKQLEQLGVDAIAIHPRTRKQRYQKRADWPLVRKVKENTSIPIILSGDVTNTYMAYMAFAHTKCDYVMCARGAKANPSLFTQLVNWYKTKEQPQKPETLYVKTRENAIKDFEEFLKLYKERENRYKFSELQDHAIWTASGCLGASRVKQRLLAAKKEEQLARIIGMVKFPNV